MIRKIVPVAALATLVALGGWWMASAPGTPPDLGAANAEEAADIDTSGIVEMTMGPADAKVTVIEYASFTCPHCATFHEGTLKKMKADYVETGKVQFIYRDVFFDRFGLWASMIARCETDRFFGLTDLLYAQQRDWIGKGGPSAIADNLRKIGKISGLSEETLNACLEDGDKARALVAWFQNHADADGIEATPTLVINGEKHSNMSYSDLKELLDAKLAE